MDTVKPDSTLVPNPTNLSFMTTDKGLQVNVEEAPQATDKIDVDKQFYTLASDIHATNYQDYDRVYKVKDVINNITEILPLVWNRSLIMQEHVLDSTDDWNELQPNSIHVFISDKGTNAPTFADKTTGIVVSFNLKTDEQDKLYQLAFSIGEDISVALRGNDVTLDGAEWHYAPSISDFETFKKSITDQLTSMYAKFVDGMDAYKPENFQSIIEQADKSVKSIEDNYETQVDGFKSDFIAKVDTSLQQLKEVQESAEKLQSEVEDISKQKAQEISDNYTSQLQDLEKKFTTDVATSITQLKATQQQLTDIQTSIKNMDVSKFIDMTQYYTKTETNNVIANTMKGYSTSTETNANIDSRIDAALNTFKAAYYTQAQIDAKVATLQNNLKNIDLSAYYTKTQVDALLATTNTALNNKIEGVTVNGADVPIASKKAIINLPQPDLSNYVTKDYVNNKVDNLQIGSRNYVLNSNEKVTVAGTNIIGQLVNTWSLSPDIINIASGSTVTISYDVLVTNADTGMSYLGMSSPWTVLLSAITYKSGMNRISLTLKLPRAFVTGETLQMTVDSSKASYVVSNLKLEQGSIATDWTPAPEDKADESKVVELQTQVDNSAVGTNLIVQSELKIGYLDGDTGDVVASSTDFHSDNYIATNGATVFTLSSPDYAFKGNGVEDRVVMYDSDKKYLGSQGITSATQTLSKPNVAYIRFSINFTDEGGASGNLSGWLSNHRYKLEKGSVATDYSLNPLDIATSEDVANQIKANQPDLSAYVTNTGLTSTLNTTLGNYATKDYVTQTADQTGDVSKLLTKDKSSYVSAINELASIVDRFYPVASQAIPTDNISYSNQGLVYNYDPSNNTVIFRKNDPSYSINYNTSVVGTNFTENSGGSAPLGGIRIYFNFKAIHYINKTEGTLSDINYYVWNPNDSSTVKSGELGLLKDIPYYLTSENFKVGSNYTIDFSGNGMNLSTSGNNRISPKLVISNTGNGVLNITPYHGEDFKDDKSEGYWIYPYITKIVSYSVDTTAMKALPEGYSYIYVKDTSASSTGDYLTAWGRGSYQYKFDLNNLGNGYSIDSMGSSITINVSVKSNNPGAGSGYICSDGYKSSQFPDGTFTTYSGGTAIGASYVNLLWKLPKEDVLSGRSYTAYYQAATTQWRESFFYAIKLVINNDNTISIYVLDSFSAGTYTTFDPSNNVGGKDGYMGSPVVTVSIVNNV